MSQLAVGKSAKHLAEVNKASSRPKLESPDNTLYPVGKSVGIEVSIVSAESVSKKRSASFQSKSSKLAAKTESSYHLSLPPSVHSMKSKSKSMSKKSSLKRISQSSFNNEEKTRKAEKSKGEFCCCF